MNEQTTITNNDDRILDCGHKPSPHSDFTTGTAHYTDNASGQDKEICWDCAYDRQVAEMKTSDKFVAYLESAKGYVTDWTGRKLGKITQIAKRNHNMAGTMFYFRIEDVSGQTWYGRGVSDGMYCRLRKAKVGR